MRLPYLELLSLELKTVCIAADVFMLCFVVGEGWLSDFSAVVVVGVLVLGDVGVVGVRVVPVLLVLVPWCASQCSRANACLCLFVQGLGFFAVVLLLPLSRFG